MTDLLKNIPLLLAYFVPGYLARVIFTRLTRWNNGESSDGKSESKELVLCIVISFLSTNVSQLCFPKSGTVFVAVVSTLLAIVVALIVVLLMRCNRFQKLFERITRTTIHL